FDAHPADRGFGAPLRIKLRTLMLLKYRYNSGSHPSLGRMGDAREGFSVPLSDPRKTALKSTFSGQPWLVVCTGSLYRNRRLSSSVFSYFVTAFRRRGQHNDGRKQTRISIDCPHEEDWLSLVRALDALVAITDALGGRRTPAIHRPGRCRRGIGRRRGLFSGPRHQSMPTET